ncbi:MAG: hypothetical protein Aurels2KO_37820 [Aureliella sp.]
MARVFWQDSATQTVHWGDLKRGDSYSLEKQELAEHPEVDPERHMLVQMKAIDELVLLGVRDDDDGNFKSGWGVIDTGAEKESHGDHFHWHLEEAPSVKLVQLDDKQGNPAHVYRYGNSWYLANDKKNGFTRVTPDAIRSGAKPDEFYSAGGGHITMAVSKNQTGYSTWIDRDGENMGRVDVVGLDSSSPINYSFFLPSGGIHGATYNSGKAFFAPSEGVCWVSTQGATQEPKVHHIDLGEDASGAAKRTGAFANAGNHVLFVAGRGADSELCSIDAASPKPVCLKMDLGIGKGNSALTPSFVKTRSGRKFAVVFEENTEADGEKMHVVDLDSNRDGDFSDAKVAKTFDVGKSQIQGHSGHHGFADLGGRILLVSNPGDGTITVISTRDWTVEETLDVGGTPTRLICIGG